MADVPWSLFIRSQWTSNYGLGAIFLLKEWENIWNQHFEFQIQDRRTSCDHQRWTAKIQPRLGWGSCPLPLERTVACWILFVYGEGAKCKDIWDIIVFKRFERHLCKLSACLIVAKLNLLSPLVLDCCRICFCRTFISNVFFATATVPSWKVVELGKPTIVSNGKRRTQNVLNKKNSHCFRCKIHFYVGNAEVHTKQNNKSTISEKCQLQ